MKNTVKQKPKPLVQAEIFWNFSFPKAIHSFKW